METYGKILLIAIPAFLVLVLFEKWYGWYKGNDTVRNMDMISSLSSGITNVTKDVLALTIPIIAYGAFAHYLQVYTITTTWLTYVIAFLVIDFSGYWVHRWNHEVNVFWNIHIIHHSSEEYNLACALRQSISLFINPFTFLLIPAAMLGIPEKVIATVGPLQLFAQFWYHTRHINKMGILEKVIVTPSHHRVHHAFNKEYLDKNYSQILIIWDKLFGTFQEERDDLPPVYGITRPVRTWNPIRINFVHLWLIMKDCWRTKSVKDKFRVWFRPTGWRPADVIEKYPVEKIDDVYHFDKYDPKASGLLKVWSWIQLLVLLLAISYLFSNIAYIKDIHLSWIYIYGGYVFLAVFAMTELMDRNPGAIFWELLKNAYGVVCILECGDWFGANKIYGNYVTIAVYAYFGISTLVTAYFVQRHKQEDSGQLAFAG